jgi:CBS domain-containing protein
MKIVIKGKEVLNNKVLDVMIRPLTTVPPDTPVVQALDLMRKKNIRRLPVVSDGHLHGIVTIHRDLLYWALAPHKGAAPE